MHIPLQQCLLSQGKGRYEKKIFLQGLSHVARRDKDLYSYLNTIENQFYSAGYRIVRERMDLSSYSTHGLSDHVKQILETFHWIIELYASAPGRFGGSIESEAFAVRNSHVVIDAPVVEYAERLAKEGYKPDLALIKYLIKHEYDSARQTDPCYLRMVEKFGSWEKMCDHAINSIELKSLKQTMSWREQYIMSRVESMMAEESLSKVAMFNGDYHVGGFAAILLEKGWEILYSKNLMLRYSP